MLVTVADVLLGAGTAGYEVLAAASGAGAVIGRGPRSGQQHPRARLVESSPVFVVVAALSLAALGVVGSLAVAAVVVGVAGSGAMLAEISAIGRLQRRLAEQTLAAAFGVLDSIVVLAMVAGAGIAPIAIATIGARPTLMLCGAMVAALPLVTDRPRPRRTSAPSSKPAGRKNREPSTTNQTHDQGGRRRRPCRRGRRDRRLTCPSGRVRGRVPRSRSRTATGCAACLAPVPRPAQTSRSKMSPGLPHRRERRCTRTSRLRLARRSSWRWPVARTTVNRRVPRSLRPPIVRQPRRPLGPRAASPGSAADDSAAASDELCALATELFEQDDFPSVEQLQRYQQLAPDVDRRSGARRHRSR